MIDIDNMFGKKIKKNNFKSFNFPKFDMFSKNNKLFRQKLQEDKNISFGYTTTPRERKIITKQFRKDPQMLSLKSDDQSITIHTEKQKEMGAFGMIKPEERYTPKKLEMGIQKEFFEQEYDPLFVEHVEKKIKKSPTKEDLEEERQRFVEEKKFKLYRASKPVLTRTLGHEMEHVRQSKDKIEDEDDYLIFYDSYKEDPEHYEELADREGLKSVERRQTKYPEDPEVLTTLSMDDEVSKDAWRKIKRTDYVVEMTPDEYLRATGIDEPEKYKPETYHDYESNVEEPISKLSDKIVGSDVEVELPYVDSETIYLNFPDHEGRHRAYAAKLAGEEKIPVIVPPPDTWRTEEIKDEFVKRAFPRDVGTEYEDQWKSSIDNRFPFQHATLDMRGRKIYREILQEKDLISKEDEESKGIYMYDNKNIREDRR